MIMETQDIIVAQRLPIWLSIEEKRSVGGWLVPSDAYPVGYVFKAGTPVQLGYIGEYPKFGEEAERPVGLLASDVVMGSQGCTLAYVTRGVFLMSAAQYAISRPQIDYLKKRITFVYAKEDGENPEEKERSCFSEGFWVNALAWSNVMAWLNR